LKKEINKKAIETEGFLENAEENMATLQLLENESHALKNLGEIIL
jgi:hypothetical protein